MIFESDKIEINYLISINEPFKLIVTPQESIEIQLLAFAQGKYWGGKKANELNYSTGPYMMVGSFYMEVYNSFQEYSKSKVRPYILKKTDWNQTTTNNIIDMITNS